MAQQNLNAMFRRASTLSRFWGVLLIVFGLLALGSPMVASVATNVVISWLIVLAGLVHVAVAFQRGEVGSNIWRVLVGLAYLAFGIYLIRHPAMGLALLTLVLALLFLLEGISEIALFSQVRSAHGSGWFLLKGIVTLVLGLTIYQQWPSSSGWIVGTLVGLNLMISGITRVMLSLAVRAALKKVYFHTLPENQAGQTAGEEIREEPLKKSA